MAYRVRSHRDAQSNDDDGELAEGISAESIVFPCIHRCIARCFWRHCRDRLRFCFPCCPFARILSAHIEYRKIPLQERRYRFIRKHRNDNVISYYFFLFITFARAWVLFANWHVYYSIRVDTFYECMLLIASYQYYDERYDTHVTCALMLHAA